MCATNTTCSDLNDFPVSQGRWFLGFLNLPQPPSNLPNDISGSNAPDRFVLFDIHASSQGRIQILAPQYNESLLFMRLYNEGWWPWKRITP